MSSYVYILIIWSAFLNSPKHNGDGAIYSVRFTTKTNCEYALKAIKDVAKNISGVCVPEGVPANPSGSVKPGRMVQVLPNSPNGV